MQKQITSALLVAGTCIGGGTIALPMALAKLGIVPSLMIMIFVWLLTYYTSLVSVELNLQSERGLSLGMLGKVLGGKIAGIIGEISVKLLCYALMSVYIYGAASIVQKLIEVYWHCNISDVAAESGIAVLTLLMLLCPFKTVSRINNIAFMGFTLIFLMLICVMINFVNCEVIPWAINPSANNIVSVVTIVFTSFGYQVIFHTLRDYCGKNVKILRRAFFYGSVITVIVYMLWIGSALSVIFKSNPEFFAQMIVGKVEVGDFVKELAGISKIPNFQILVWWMSILAIFTSIIGVGLGLEESLELFLKDNVNSEKTRKLMAVLDRKSVV